MAPTKTTKKAPSKSKETQAKGKENAASTAALQAEKKKNQLRKDSGLGMLYHGLNDSFTAMFRHFLFIFRLWLIQTLLKLVGLEVAQPLPHQQLRRLSN
jgi:hypothetical protein